MKIRQALNGTIDINILKEYVIVRKKLWQWQKSWESKLKKYIKYFNLL